MAHIEILDDAAMVLRDDWYVDDVLSIRPDLTEEQAEDVLEKVADTHDCNIGITWEVIEIHANNLFPLSEDKNDTD